MTYLHASLDGLASLFTLQALAGMLVGIAWGFLVSFMPGVGGNVAIALLLPFIFRLPVPAALALLLGTHIATYFGGSITSITMNIPASAKSVSLCWDGYPLARKGKGAYALGASATASSLGGVVGAIVLTLGIPAMKQLLNVIGSPEIFMLAVWGVVIIAIFSSGDLMKGVMAGGLGILLSWVGQSPITGLDRLTFGSEYLSQGIPFAAAAMGLFAVAQAIRTLSETRTEAAAHRSAARSGAEPPARPVLTPQASRTLDGALAVLKRWRLSLYMSLFGVFTGTIPGLGAPVAAIAAYGQAGQMSKNKDFGSGAIEGVIAPQATDGAAEGGGMLPMLSLGIPTHEQQAILLSAFIVLGIAPGPTMLTDHLDVVFAVIWIIVVANLIVGAIGLLTGRYLARLSTLPAHLLVPLIVVIAVVGTFAVNGRIGDAVTAVVFGLMGYLCFKYNYSRVNLIIGLALGPVLESNLNISAQLYGGGFVLRRPVALGLAVVIMATIGWWLWTRRRAQARGTAASGPAGQEGRAVSGPQGWGAVAAAAGFVAVFAVALVLSLGYSPLTGGVVEVVSGVCLVLAVANAVRVAVVQLRSASLAAAAPAPGVLSASTAVPATANGPGAVPAGSPARPAVTTVAGASAARPGGPPGRGPAAGMPGRDPAASGGTGSAVAGRASLVSLALERRRSRESAAGKTGYQFTSAVIVVGFLAAALVVGIIPGAGVAMACYRLRYSTGQGWRRVTGALAWGLAVSAVTWLLFDTLVSQFIPYPGLLFPGPGSG